MLYDSGTAETVCWELYSSCICFGVVMLDAELIERTLPGTLSTLSTVLLDPLGIASRINAAANIVFRVCEAAVMLRRK